MKYSYILHTPTGNKVIADNVNPFEVSEAKEILIPPYSVKITNQEKGGCCLTEITVSSDTEAEVYVSVYGEGEADLYSFAKLCEDERLFRQSPHDPFNYHFKMEKSAVPMVAAVVDGQADFFISDNPSYFDNATTQHIIPAEKCFYLSSGDRGGAPNYPESEAFGPIFHTIDAEQSHLFRFFTFKKPADSLKTVRREAFVAIENVFGTCSDSIYRAMCFSSNYMHIRKNERRTSDKWVVAGIEYGNTQYFRDSFYQTFILDEEIEQQAYQAAGDDVDSFCAEHPLIYMIWSYRVFSKGKEYNREVTDIAFRDILKAMDKHPDGGFYATTAPGHVEGTFKNWFDICAFEDDDADVYNCGLLICALECAKRMGYDIGDRKERAIKKFHSIFNGKYFQISQKKDFMVQDFAVGEVIYYYLFNETFIDDEMVRKSYRAMVDGPAKTPYGIKIVAMADGSYVPYEMYEANGKRYEMLENCEPGRYYNGGSYHIYEMLFHICAYLHNIEDAEQNMIERLMIDLDYDGATHEYMHTVRGFGGKPNQGWNASIYAFWEELVKRGRATTAFFDAAEAKLKSL
jgi:hypothetical protein